MVKLEFSAGTDNNLSKDLIILLVFSKQIQKNILENI